MTQLINKSALIAEIEKVIDEPAPSHDQQCPWEDGCYCGLNKVENIINSLEVKEVNLEKEIKNGIDSLSNLYCYMEDLFNGNEEEGVYPIPEKVKNELFEFAKHFFELGLKAQKGE